MIHDPYGDEWDIEIVRGLESNREQEAHENETDIFKYDPDEILADPFSHPIHRRIAAINIRVRDYGEKWAKCANCGEPYQVTYDWSSETICSRECGRELTADMNGSSW